MFNWTKKKFYTTQINFKPNKLDYNILKKLFNFSISSNLSKKDFTYFNNVKKKFKGTSKNFHFAFFKKFKAKKILILGVYYCFDLNLINYSNKNSIIVGVDKFNDKFCRDWPKSKKKLTWDKAGYGVPPPNNPNQLLHKIKKQGPLNNNSISIIKSDDIKYLKLLINKKKKFDLIYLDTSHDYKTVINQIKFSKKLINKNGIIAGDDYSDHGTWGVKKAVTEAFDFHHVFCDRIWFFHRSIK
jgi:hypothetical protein